MVRSIRAGFTLFLWSFLLLPSSALAVDLKIVDFNYNQHFNPGEAIDFTVRVRNNEPTAQGAELLVLLTSNSTGTLEAADVGSTGTIASGDTFTFRVTLGTFTSVQPAGVYTVALRLLDGNGARTDQVNAKFPIHIGTNTESVRVFPEIISLGSLGPGRVMHPMPITVTWSFFRFNRLRLDQPFTIRIYTDNAARYQGIPGSVRRGSPAGLVSLDGRYVIPLKIWNLNYGPDIHEAGWDSALAGPPPVDEDDAWLGPALIEGGRNQRSASWVRVPDLTDMTADPMSWRRLIGQDPHDDRFASDTNPVGDFTLKSPFTFYIATEAGAAAVEGAYAATLVVELWNP